MFQDHRLDHITDAIMTGRRVDASTILWSQTTEKSGASDESAAEG